MDFLRNEADSANIVYYYEGKYNEVAAKKTH